MKFPCLFLLLLLQTCTAMKEDLPVILIDSNRVMSHLATAVNPFAKMSTDYFANIIRDSVKSSECIIIFIEDKLCSEDISMRDHQGTPYHRLRSALKDKKIKFMPSVVQPYRTLTQIFPLHQDNVFFLSSGSKVELPGNFEYIYIFFEDEVGEPRGQSLRRHDIIMQDLYVTVRRMRLGPVIAFYTGITNPISTEKKKFVAFKPMEEPANVGVMVASEGALFKFSGVYSSTATRRSSFNQMPVIAVETWTRRKLSTTMAYNDFELQFNFAFDPSNWILETVALLEGGEVVGRTVMGVGAPWHWSYLCGEPLIVVNNRDGSTVTISQYQIQPRYVLRHRRQNDPTTIASPVVASTIADTNTNTSAGGTGNTTEDPTKCFGKTINCGPYFNTHILSGLMVSFICICALAYAICMLYNCGTNDKFDDPHGKEVIMNVEQN